MTDTATTLPRTGLVRDRNGRWSHVSTRGNTAIFRGIESDVPDIRISLPDHKRKMDRLLEGAEIYTLGRILAELAGLLEFPSRGYPYTDRDNWSEVIAVLEDQRLEEPERTGEAADLLPVSRLRHFYESLRLMNTKTVHSSIADYLSAERDRTDALDAVFERSIQHLQRYRNTDQPFYSGSSRDWFEKYHDRPEQFARCLQARLAPLDGNPKRLGINGSDLEYIAVDYEVSPLRTAGGRWFEDGRSARSSGAGGMDLLFATTDRVPVIGEVKAPTDTSVFVALIQALTYACEILTKQQVDRLAKVYPSAFSRSREPTCEILILVAAGDSPGLDEQTTRIIQRLMGKETSAIAKHVRRITLAEATLDGEGGASLALRYSVASSYHSPSESIRTGGSNSAAAAPGDAV